MEYYNKRYLLGRNQIRTLLRNFSGPNLIRLARPIGSHVWEIYDTVRHPLSRSIVASIRRIDLNMRILADLTKAPSLRRAHAKLNAGRKIDDRKIWELSEKLHPYLIAGGFYDAAHAPILSLRTVCKTYELAARLTGKNELSNRARHLKELRLLLSERKWLVDNPEEMKSTAIRGYRLSDFIATASGKRALTLLWKRTQSIATSPFVVDLLLSFHGRTTSEINIHLREKVKRQLSTGRQMDPDGLKTPCATCVTVFQSHFAEWQLIKRSGST
jgi:hypothetical protein